MGWATKNLATVRKNIKDTAAEIKNEVKDNIMKIGEKKITPKAWQKEKAGIEKWIAERTLDISAKCYDLAICEIIKYDPKDLRRIIGNGERTKGRQIQQSRDQNGKKHREECL